MLTVKAIRSTFHLPNLGLRMEHVSLTFPGPSLSGTRAPSPRVATPPWSTFFFSHPETFKDDGVFVRYIQPMSHFAVIWANPNSPAQLAVAPPMAKSISARRMHYREVHHESRTY